MMTLLGGAGEQIAQFKWPIAQIIEVTTCSVSALLVPIGVPLGEWVGPEMSTGPRRCYRLPQRPINSPKEAHIRVTTCSKEVPKTRDRELQRIHIQFSCLSLEGISKNCPRSADKGTFKVCHIVAGMQIRGFQMFSNSMVATVCTG